MGDHKCFDCLKRTGTIDPDCMVCGGTGYDTSNTQEPVCPHCGEEMSSVDIYDSGDYQCEHCEGWSSWEIEYVPWYTTEKIGDPTEKNRKLSEAWAKWKEQKGNA